MTIGRHIYLKGCAPCRRPPTRDPCLLTGCWLVDARGSPNSRSLFVDWLLAGRCQRILVILSYCLTWFPVSLVLLVRGPNASSYPLLEFWGLFGLCWRVSLGSIWGPFGVHLGSIWGPSSIHLGVHAWGSVRRPFLPLFTALGGCQGRFARAWRA